MDQAGARRCRSLQGMTHEPGLDKQIVEKRGQLPCWLRACRVPAVGLSSSSQQPRESPPLGCSLCR